MKFSIKDFFCKCDQIRRKLWIWSYLLKKSLMENFIFCAVFILSLISAVDMFGFNFRVIKYGLLKKESTPDMLRFIFPRKHQMIRAKKISSIMINILPLFFYFRFADLFTNICEIYFFY